MAEEITKRRGTIGAQRTGIFEEYTIQGKHYCNETESLGWLMDSWPGRDPVHQYWVEDSKFYAVRISTAHEYSDRFVIDILGLKTVDPKEKSAILNAISTWTEELQQLA